jgi:hypothetical protein
LRVGALEISGRRWGAFLVFSVLACWAFSLSSWWVFSAFSSRSTVVLYFRRLFVSRGLVILPGRGFFSFHSGLEQATMNGATSGQATMNNAA